MTVTLSLWSEAPYFFVNGELPESVIDRIDQDLSYEIEGHQYSDSWQEGSWDGRGRLLNESSNGNWFFPIGVLDRVTRILELSGIDYEVEGLVRPGRGDLGLAWESDKTLREYQAEAVNEAMREGHGIIEMPPGTGKTFTGLRVMYELQRSAIVCCDTTEIADQWVNRIEDTLGVEPAICYGGERQAGDIQVALYQSVHDEDYEVRDDVRLDHDVFVADECHNVAARTFSAVALSINAPYRYGMSATPYREDNKTLEVFGGTGPIIYSKTAEEMIENGWLTEPDWELYEAPHSGGIYQNWQAEYAGEIVENSGRNELIADVAEGLDRPTMITVERINHGERLQSLIDGAALVYSDHPDREENIEAFRDGDLDILIATRGLVGEGFDAPKTRSFVIAGGLKSEVSTLQQVGRVLRPETDTATIVDFADRGEWVGEHTEQRFRVYQDYFGDFGP